MLLSTKGSGDVQSRNGWVLDEIEMAAIAGGDVRLLHKRRAVRDAVSIPAPFAREKKRERKTA